MTSDPLRGDPECPEVQSVRRCARRLIDPEPEIDEWMEVQSPAEVALERRSQAALGVLTVCTALAVSAPILTALCLLIVLTRRLV